MKLFGVYRVNNATTYPITFGYYVLGVFIFLFVLPMALAVYAVNYDPHPNALGDMALILTILIIFGLPTLGAVISAKTTKLILHEDAIGKTSLFGSKKLLLNNLQGYRIIIV